MAVAGPEDLEVAGLDGTRLKGRLWSPEGTTRRLLVLVHGLKDHGGRYGELAGVLTSRGIAVAAFDLRGHGRSAGERAFVSRFSVYGSDLQQEWEELIRRHPGVPVSLFGHSLGGAVAARYALDHEGRVNSLVLSAPALAAPKSTSKGTVAVVLFVSAVFPHARVFKPDIPGFSRVPAVLEAMAHDPLIDPKPVAARTVAELLRAMPTIHADAGRLTAPLLVLHGSSDRVADPRGSEAFVAEVHSSSRRLRWIPGAYHDLLHEPEAPLLRAEIADWLDSSSAQP